MSSSLCARVLCSSAVLATVLVGQDEVAGGRRAAIAEAVQLWVDDYEQGRLAPTGPLQRDAGLQPRYARVASAAGLFSAADAGALTHLDGLQKLLSMAEHDPDEPIGAATLSVAAAGFDKSLIDRDAVVLRDIGHWSLMRMEHQGVWFLIMRTAAGRQSLLAAEVDDDGRPAVDPALRVAALRLLGMKRWPVFRGTIEGTLGDVDPRVRLAAVEAIEFQRRPDSLALLTRVLAVEHHPVVTQGLTRAVLATLTAAGAELRAEDRDRAMQTAMRLFGQISWRTDMDLMALVEAFPHRRAVEPLIAILERGSSVDALEQLVNRQASPLLKARAHECLRGLTGAIIPIDRPAEWRAFWATNQRDIVVPEQLPHRRQAVSTASTFFGIPVQGREIAFLIDTSGSMDEAFGSRPVTGRARRRERGEQSRLMAAKEQLLQAVQVMAPESRYHVLTFADGVQTWSRKAVPPTAAATRSLVELLSRLHAQGGTNVYEALVGALALDELHFAQEGKQSIDELFLLSDGEPTAGRVQDPHELLRLLREANRYLHVRINTVFTGTGSGADFLRRLAEENGGVFVQR